MLDRKISLQLVLIMFMLPSSVWQATAGGPWTQKKNSGYSKIGFTYLGYNKLFGPNGTVVDLRRDMTDMIVQGYVEYGITDKFTVLGVLPYKIVQSGDDIYETDYVNDTLAAGSAGGLSNAVLGLRYQIAQFNRYSLAVQVNGEAPATGSDPAKGLYTGYDAWSVAPSVALGGGWDKGYFAVDAGMRYRTNNFSNEITASVEGGYKLGGKTWLILRTAARISLQDGKEEVQQVMGEQIISPAAQTGLSPNNQQYIGYGLKVNHNFSEHFGVNLGVFGGQGELVAATPSPNIGVSYQW